MQQFNSKEDYSIVLNNLRKDFEARWQNQESSPYTNLEGYVQRAIIGNGSFGTVVSLSIQVTRLSSTFLLLSGMFPR